MFNQFKKQRLQVALSAGILTFVTAMLLQTQQAFAGSNDLLTVGMSAEFENLHPTIASQGATSYMQYLAYRPLIVLSPEGKWMPMLIKEIPTLANKMVKVKGKTLEVKIEILDNAKWGDNKPVVCKDIEMNWILGKNPNVSVPSRDAFESITSITWDNAKPKTCTIVFNKVRYDYFLNIPDPIPEHIEGPIYAKYKDTPEAYDHNSAYTKNPTNPGLYNGPYVITDVKLGSHLSFAINPNYGGTPAKIKKVIFKLIPNNATLEANLRSGNIDMISSAAGLGPDQAVIFDKKVKSESLPFNVIFEDGNIYAHIDLNMATPALADIRVRRALSLAFDKKEMIDSLLEGKGKPAIHFITDRDSWFTDKVTIYNYNKREASKLLDEAGWKMGPDGYRYKNNEKLSLNLMAAAGAKLNELIQTYLQEKFKAVGIQLTVKNEPARVFFGETTTHRKFQMALYSWVSTPESDPYSTLHSKSIPSEKNAWAGQNYTGFNNKKVDQLIESIQLELDAKKRAELAKKVAAIYTEEVPVIPVYFRPSNVVIPKAMKGFRASGHKFYETLYIENWTF